MTSRKTAALLWATAALALAPATAHAGAPYVLGNAAHSTPHVTADSDPGVFHVVWQDAAARVYTYCQVVLGQPGCAKGVAIPGIDAANNGDPIDPEPAWVVTDPNGGPLRVIMPSYISGHIFESVSLDNGTTFSAPRIVKDNTVALGVNIGRPVLEADGQTSLLPHSGTDGLQLAQTGSNAILKLDDTGQAPVSGYDPALATVTAGTLGVVDDLENVFVYGAAAGSTLLSPGSWTPSTLVTKTASKTALAGNGTEAFLASTADAGQSRYRVEIRRWGGMAFGAPKVVEKTKGLFADLSVSRNGFAGLVYYDSPAIHYADINDKGKYVPKTIAVTDENVSDMNVAHDDDGTGLVVWANQDGIRAADLTEVQDKSIPPLSKSKTKHGKTLGLNVPGSCVVAGKKFGVSSGGQGAGKLEKIVYKLEGGKSETDEKGPYGVSLLVPAKTPPGTRLAVTATYYVTSKKAPKHFTFSNVLPVDVCGG